MGKLIPIHSQDFRVIPKRKITEAEKQILSLRIEKMKLEREKSLLILGSAIMLFVAFLVVAIIGLTHNLITTAQLNLLVLVGFIALIVGILPYIRFVMHETKSLENTLDELTT